MLDFRQYNDFEIIDYVKQGNEEALSLMVEKYRYLIAKKISKFNLVDEFDDYFQEGLLILYKSILYFDESKRKTFTRFFEMNYERHLISALRKRKHQRQFQIEKYPLLCEETVLETPKSYVTEAEIRDVLTRLSPFEKTIYQQRFIENQTIRAIAKNHGIDEKKVYNAIERIRKKIKLHLET